MHFFILERVVGPLEARWAALSKFAGKAHGQPDLSRQSATMSPSACPFPRRGFR
ncbi:hypothetical protein SZ54_0545 [Rhizobium sp. UR51a]|nr:hypothetical protein SZ54_0545 [Rhizobium sp. UR51a]